MVCARYNNVVVLTTANFLYRDMLMNWLCHLKKVDVKNFLVVSVARKVNYTGGGAY